MNFEKAKLPVKYFMGPSRILIYLVVNSETKEVVFKEYIAEPCNKLKNKLNKEAGEKIFKVEIDFIEAEFSEVYDEDFVDEEDIVEEF